MACCITEVQYYESHGKSGFDNDKFDQISNSTLRMDTALTDSRTIGRREATLQHAWVVIMLCLIGFVVNRFEIEIQLNLALWFPILIGGFLIHSLLPFSYRLKFFVLLAPLSAIYLFGWKETAFMAGLFVWIFGLTELPVSLRLKKIGIIATAVILALFKGGYVTSYIPSGVVTIVASLFMFRMIIYLYELKFQKNPLDFWQRLAYFAMVPNLIFPLYPVVDLKTFVKTYYDQPDVQIYARGIELMTHGILHLVLYRIVYLYAVPDIDQIMGGWDSFQYIITSYLLILRLSGIFHLIVGMLCLFGFNLPDIFNNYFLANGFDDYWRRINIYWKDFALKVFYYPVYFKIKQLGRVRGIVITTMLVFGFTWFLHAYQWFWVLGKFNLRATDIFFWSVFGVLVTIGAYRQAIGTRWESRNALVSSYIRAVNITGTFLIVAILWSIWVSPTFDLWFAVMSPLIFEFSQMGLVAGAIILGVIVLGLMLYVYDSNATIRAAVAGTTGRNRFLLTLVIICMTLIGVQSTRDMLSKGLDYDFNEIRTFSLNKNDEDAQFIGYYEEMLAGNDFMNPTWAVESRQEESWVKLNDTKIVEPTYDILIKSLKPNAEIVFKGEILSTNQWGMRDRDYPRVPEEGTTRIAMLGGSSEMGSGVKNHEVFENLVEDKFAEEHPEFKFELMNFAVGARSLIQNIYYLETEILEFQPTHILVFHHERDWQVTLNLFGRILREARIKGGGFPYEELNEILEESGLKSTHSKKDIRKILSDYKVPIFEWAYDRLAGIAANAGMEVIWVHVPDVNRRDGGSFAYNKAYELAQKHGFTCLTLDGVYDGYTINDIQVELNDNHPNALGHQLIADKLYPMLVGRLINQDKIE